MSIVVFMLYYLLSSRLHCFHCWILQESFYPIIRSCLCLSGSTKSARGLQNQHCRLVSAVSEQTASLLKALGVKCSALRWYPSNLCSVCVVVVVVAIHFAWEGEKKKFWQDNMVWHHAWPEWVIWAKKEKRPVAWLHRSADGQSGRENSDVAFYSFVNMVSLVWLLFLCCYFVRLTLRLNPVSVYGEMHTVLSALNPSE